MNDFAYARDFWSCPVLNRVVTESKTIWKAVSMCLSGDSVHVECDNWKSVSVPVTNDEVWLLSSCVKWAISETRKRYDIYV